MKRIILFLALVSAVFPQLQETFAQTTTGTISGVLKDTTGSILPGVTVTIKNLETGIIRTVVTDDSGRYRAPALTVGDYEVKAELPGFKAAVRSGITITVNSEVMIDFVLEVGEITERVVVVGQVPIVDTTSPALSGLVDEKKIRDLPLNGRGFERLALLQPGVFFITTSVGSIVTGKGIKLAVNGARDRQNLFMLDGLEINDGRNSTPGGMAGALLGVEAVREFQVLTSTYSAEFGRAGGAIINAVTKSGTNEFHGSFFEFLRNDALDARNFFDPSKNPPEFKRNQFGGTFGGPIGIPGLYRGKNRSFFFLNYEGLRERLGISGVSVVPNELARRGFVPDPRAGRLIEVEVSPVIKPFLDLFPLPNGRDLGLGLAEFRFSRSRPTDENFFVVRMDHKFSDKDSLFARYAFDDSFVESPLAIPIFAAREESRNQYLAVEEARILSPGLLNTFRFGFNRSRFGGENVQLVPVGPELSFLPGEAMGTIANRGGLATLGTQVDLPRQTIQNLFEYSDQITLTKGRNSLKGGLSIKRYQWNDNSPFLARGLFTFNSLQDFLAGKAADLQAMLPGSDAIRGWRQSLFALFAQEDFKFHPRLMLNLGFRYEFVTVPIEANGKMSNLRFPSDAQPTLGKIIRNPSLRNFAPRVGFAWDPLGDAKFSIRAGFGIFYDQVLWHYYRFPGVRIPPFFKGIGFLLNPPFPRPPFELLRAPGALSLQTIRFDISTPYLMQYNLTFQKEIAPDTVLTAGYVGSRGVKLIRRTASNSAVPLILDGRKFFPERPRRRNPNFADIAELVSDASSFFNSFQLSVNRRFSGGLQFQATYTLSKNIDDATSTVSNEFINGPLTPIDPDNRKLDRGLSSLDVRHNLIINYTYDLPFARGVQGTVGKLLSGWQINGITTIAAGTPFTVINGFNRARNLLTGALQFSDRPDLRPGFSNNPRLGGPDRYFDPEAFRLQPGGFIGNLGRNTLIGPGLVNFDFSLVKSLAVSEAREIQFRVETFNLFNRPNFAIPSNAPSFIGGAIVFNDPSGVPVPTAGKIFQTVTASRQIQFAIKYIF